MYRDFQWTSACSSEKFVQLLFDHSFEEGINGWELKNKSMMWERDSYLLENARCRALGLGNNKLEEIAFTRSLRLNSHLRYLDLCYNRIGDKGAKTLAAAFKTNDVLESVFLYENRIGDSGAKAIAGAIKVNSALKRLDLARNFIGNKGARALGVALKSNKKLICLNLRANHIYSHEAVARVQKYLQRNVRSSQSSESLSKLARAVKLVYLKIKCNEAFLDLFVQIYEPGRSGTRRLERHFSELNIRRTVLLLEAKS